MDGRLAGRIGGWEDDIHTKEAMSRYTEARSRNHCCIEKQ